MYTPQHLVQGKELKAVECEGLACKTSDLVGADKGFMGMAKSFCAQ